MTVVSRPGPVDAQAGEDDPGPGYADEEEEEENLLEGLDEAVEEGEGRCGF